MDCSKTEVFLAELKRMLKTEDIVSFDWDSTHPEDAVIQVQKWSDTHPVKTRLSVLKEQYPNILLNPDDGLPHDVCVGVLYGFEDCEGGGNYDCEKCWNTPVEDGGRNA